MAGSRVSATLEGGEGVLLRLTSLGEAASRLTAAVRGLRRWRIGATDAYSVDTFSVRPDLASMQHKFYEPKSWPMTPLLLGLRISAGSSIAAMHEPESVASALAAAHFNALVWPGAADRHRMLNAALRHGVFVLAAPSADEPTMRAAAVSDVLRVSACHPNLWLSLSTLRTPRASAC